MRDECSKQILLAECPSFTSSGFDNDIELYISLVNDKKYAMAKSLYDRKLSVRYPDEKCRIRIIRYYRKKDPRFRGIYIDAVQDLLDRVILSVKKLIDYISSLFEGNAANPYELLKNIDKALQLIPSDRKASEKFIKKLLRYAVLLNYKTEEFSKAADILGRYFDNTLFVKKKRVLPVKTEKIKEMKHEESGKPNKVTIDLDAVVFSDHDISMICIPDSIVKRTYKALAYCRLYWKQVFNQDFEKKIFLYSRKYNTPHHRIFSIVRSGRVKKHSDDVILLELYSLISRGYRYSVQEDLLMQKIWRKIKPADPALLRKRAIPASKNKSAVNNTVTVELKNSAVKTPVKEKKLKKDPGKRFRKHKVRITDIHKQSLRKKLDLLSFREVFDAHAVFAALLPVYVEKYLVKHRKKGCGNDPYVLKGAQHIIQNYIMNNYNSIMYDWNCSVEKQEVSNIGFLVSEIDTIVALCLEEVRMRRMSA